MREYYRPKIYRRGHSKPSIRAQRRMVLKFDRLRSVMAKMDSSEAEQVAMEVTDFLRELINDLA